MIDVFYPVCHDCVRNDEKIKLRNKLSFFGSVIFGIPMVPGPSLTLALHFEFGRRLQETKEVNDRKGRVILENARSFKLFHVLGKLCHGLPVYLQLMIYTCLAKKFECTQRYTQIICVCSSEPVVVTSLPRTSHVVMCASSCSKDKR